MKPTHILTSCLLLFCQVLPAQSSFKLDPKTTTYIDKAQIECIYKYSVNAPLKDSINKRVLETYTTILQANATTSKFWDWNSFKKDSIIYCSPSAISTDSVNLLTTKYYLNVSYFFTAVIIKNYPNEKMTITDEITPEDYIYTENKTERKWKLTDDTLTVCGYRCNKAISTIGGRIWYAWYAPDISISDGPWKLYGLPGLILKAQDATSTHKFEATDIRKSGCPLYLKKNILQVKAEKKQFIKNKKLFEEDSKKSLATIHVKSFEMLKGGVFINGKRSSWGSKTKYCPLELE